MASHPYSPTPREHFQGRRSRSPYECGVGFALKLGRALCHRARFLHENEDFPRRKSIPHGLIAP